MSSSGTSKKRAALVIGNNRYEPHANNLFNASNDARAIAEALGRLGFSSVKPVDEDFEVDFNTVGVSALEDIGYQAMCRALAALGRAADSAEQVVLYYAGHGIEFRGDNYLIPVGARLSHARSVEFEAAGLKCKRRSKNPSMKQPSSIGCAGVKIRQLEALCRVGRGRGMKQVELYARVRYAVQIEGLSKRAAARRFGLDPRTVGKMLMFSVPPGYVRTKPPVRPKLDPFIATIDKILADDRGVHKKQRHTSKRLFERLRDERGFTGGLTIVKDYVAGWRQRSQEMFVPLVHPPGHAQADFGEAIGLIGGVERKVHFFAFDLPHSDACFVVAYPAETTEAFCDGHVKAFAFFGGVPQSILYDNTKIVVVRILGDGKRQRTRVFAELQSHYLFQDRFGRPAKGNDKGKVEGLVGFARRNFMVPVPAYESFEALNAHLADCCRKRMSERLRGHTETIGERLERDLAALRKPLPPPYDACEKVGTRVSSLSLVRYRRNDYSVPTSFGHRQVIVRGYVHEVVITCGTEIIARHPRSYEREDFVYDPLHYLALIEQKINALDQAAPLADWQLPDQFTTLRRLLEVRMGKKGKREFVQVLRLMETFRIEDVTAGVGDAIARGAIGFDAIKHLVLCRIERRPPRLDMTVYPYLPKATVAVTSARAYMDLLAGAAP